jgi:hypothetical protein
MIDGNRARLAARFHEMGTPFMKRLGGRARVAWRYRWKRPDPALGLATLDSLDRPVSFTRFRG